MAVVAAGLISNAASMTRYDGWFLIPFVTVFFFVAGGRRRWWAGFLVWGIAAIAPLGWLGYNWWFYRNPLEFYNGPYSTKAIYERAIKAGGARQPGDHDWLWPSSMFGPPERLSAGAPLAWLGVLGAAAALWKRKWWPVIAAWRLRPSSMYRACTLPAHRSSCPLCGPTATTTHATEPRCCSLFALGAAALIAVTPAAVPKLCRGRDDDCGLVSPWLIHPRSETWAAGKKRR